MKIRLMQASDVPSLAIVHVDAWKTAYRDILPADYLATLTYTAMEARWRHEMEETVPDRFGFVAESDAGEILAFACGGVSREERSQTEAELYAIYLHPEHQRQGLGTTLFHAFAREALARDFQSLEVWVLDQNPAQAFYRRLGGERSTEKAIPIAGVHLPGHAYRWPKLAQLVLGNVR